MKVLFGLTGQSFLQDKQIECDAAALVPEIELEIVGRLIIAGAPGPKFAAKRAEPIHQHPLQERVHVLVRLGGADDARLDLRADVGERCLDACAFRLVEQTGSNKFPRMRE